MIFRSASAAFAMRGIVLLIVVMVEIMTFGQSAAATSTDKMSGSAVTTMLSAAGVTPAPKITVLTGTSVVDRATLSGVAAKGSGRIAYLVFSDSSCTTLTFDATPAPNRVRKGVVPASKAFTSARAGVVYWQAVYSRKNSDSNDDNNQNSDENNAK